MTNATLLINALVRTMDPANPFSDAVLIRDGRIAALGGLPVRRGGSGWLTPAGGWCCRGFRTAISIC